MKIEKNFSAVGYQGAFRDYQRHLLRRLDDRLDDGKMNIVTPPGSGKITLGLEIIRRLGNPCLILSSSLVMRDHWGNHFESHFLPAEERAHIGEYLSYDLHKPALLTSITYQDLYAAMEALQAKNGDDVPDFSGGDVIRLVQGYGIGTVLLDEAHHLPENWQKALETFLGVLGGEIHVVSITATPPYDIRPDEWERYVALCGEISDEICIPELVKGHALCPHQDYVYFNYPSEDETSGIRGYRIRADEAVAEAVALPFMAELNRRLTKLYSKRIDFLYNHHDAVVSLLTLLNEYGHMVNLKLYKHLAGKTKVEPLTLTAAQRAFNFLLESQTLLSDGEKDQLVEIFTRYRVMEHHRVLLAMTDKVRRTIVSSIGKLDSIAAITESEGKSLGEDLREVVLTDPLRPEDLKLVGTNHKLGHIGMVAVFETLRRRNPLLSVGCLAHEAVILPEALEQTVRGYGISEDRLRVEPIGNTHYAFYRFSQTQDALPAVTRLFEEGYIRILVGSEDVLGEGWDDTFVNTLILAAFAGSFVEANRMRGRVIHVHKDHPDKVAHIWHLVTVESEYSTAQYPSLRLASRIAKHETGIRSVDYHTLRRYFECFMGPDEESGELENGIDRLSAIKPPYDEHGMETINHAMLERAGDRKQLCQLWKAAMVENVHPISEVRVSESVKVPVLTPLNLLLLVAALVCIVAGVYYLPTMILFTYMAFVITPEILIVVALLLVLNVAAIIWGILFVLSILPLLINHLIPSVSVRSLCRGLLRAMKDLGVVNKDATLVMETMADKKTYRIYLDNCTHTEQTEYQKAVAELLSPIENPRYIMVRGGWFRRLLWKWSFACPSVIGKNDVAVKTFAKYMQFSMGSVKFQYTRRDPGRKYLIFARNHSYLNENQCKCEKRLHLLKHDRI